MDGEDAIERQPRSPACRRRAKALHAGDERKPCVLASSGNVGRCAQKAWADPSLRAWADRLPWPPTFHLVSGTIAGAMSPEGTSKRRWCSSESRPLIWYRLTRIPAEIHTTTCQATASKYSDGISSKYSDGISSKYSDGISTMQAEALAKSLLRYHLGPYAGPSGPGQRSPGPPRPPAGLTTKDVD